MHLCPIIVQTFPSAGSVLQLREPEDGHLPEFWEIWALNKSWALLQKLLSMNYGNLHTAAFNYHTEAGSKEKRTDRREHRFGVRRKDAQIG